MEILRGRADIFNGKYETKLEFPEGWGLKPENPFVGGVWMFSGTKILDNVMTKKEFLNLRDKENRSRAITSFVLTVHLTGDILDDV